MKPLIINRRSWSYRFSEFGISPRYCWSLPKNICEFRIMLLLASIRALFCSFVIGLIVTSIINWFVYDYGCFVTIRNECQKNMGWLSSIGSFSVWFGSLAIISVLTVYLCDFVKHITSTLVRYLRKNTGEYEDNKPLKVMKKPSAIEMAYRSWKEKVCYPVSVVEPDEDEISPTKDLY